MNLKDIMGRTDLTTEERSILEGLQVDVATGKIAASDMNSIKAGIDAALSDASAGCGGGGCCPWGNATY